MLHPYGELGLDTQQKLPDIEITILREKRRSLSLSRKGGQFIVKAPLQMDDAIIAAFVQRHQNWIKEKHQRISERSMFSVLGEDIDWTQRPDIQTYADRKRVHKSLCVQALRLLYAEVCEARTKSAPPLRIATLASAWGKCFSTNRIELSWKVGRLPRDLAEYVICHELAHLVHFDHSPRFWAVADELCPGARKKDRLLNSHSLDD